ncbi:hypothetical protein SJAV_20250 [Sulfurisphaera javensis]|uniref:Uncharacterized protein n=1 Tax=Sulfurisphaera javensis TaxID=2049879 RepID=A0AAT9GT90_9CREN
MPTEIVIRENNCCLKTDCVLIISFENRNILTGSHPEGMCIRFNRNDLEIAYIELKNVKQLTQNIIDDIRAKINNLILSKDGYSPNLVKCRQFANLFKFISDLRLRYQNTKLSFYLVLPEGVASTFSKNNSVNRRLRELIMRKVDDLKLIPCGDHIS